jgi:hypothetical protein
LGIEIDYKVPFEGKEIHAFLERPAGVAKPPVVLSIAETDLFHDYTAIRP